MTIVVTPVKSIMFDQVRRWNSVGIRAAAIVAHSDMRPEIARGMLYREALKQSQH